MMQVGRNRPNHEVFHQTNSYHWENINKRNQKKMRYSPAKTNGVWYFTEKEKVQIGDVTDKNNVVVYVRQKRKHGVLLRMI